MNILQTKLYLNNNIKFKQKLNNSKANSSDNKEKRNSSINFGNSIKADYRSTEIKNSYQANKAKLETFSRQKGKITKEQYEDIKQNAPELLAIAKQIIGKDCPIKSSPEIMARIAMTIKNMLDEKYGNYTIVSVGTSPAIISEALESTGCKVVYLPISALNNITCDPDWYEHNDKITKEEDLPNLKHAMNYLHSKIDQNSDDKIILLDYTQSGKTLTNLRQLIVNRGEIEKERIAIFSIFNNLVMGLHSRRNYDFLISEEELMGLEYDFYNSTTELVANVPHFGIRDEQNKTHEHCVSSENKAEEEIFEEFESFSQPYARLFSLCTIDEMQKLKQA